MTKAKPLRELEYLESTGTQWIDTGYAINTATDEITFTFELLETNMYKWFFGEYDENNRIGLGSGDGTDKRNFLYQQPATKVADTKMYNGQHVYKADSTGGYLDGTKIVNYSNFASTSSIYLFNLNISSTSDYRCRCRIWNYQHKRNNELILDLVPAFDQNKVPCMYDRVSGNFLYNEDSGLDFVYKFKNYKCQVAYLESTGTQYIDTGLIQTGIGLKADLVYTQLTTPTSEQAIIGRNGGNGYELYAQGAKFGLWNAPSKQVVTANTLTLNKPYHFIGEVSSTGINLNSDGTNYSWSGSTEEGTSPTTATVTIFNHNSNYCATGRIYYCKLYDNGILVRDLIPVLDWNDRPALYDKVEGKFYYNAGTGEFIVKHRNTYTELEYLESTGTQYINLGLPGKNNLDFEYKTTFTRIDSNAQSIGGNWSLTTTSNQSFYFGLVRSNGNFAYHYDGTSQPVVVMNTTEINKEYTIHGHMWKGDQYFIINGDKSSVETRATTFTADINMHLFAVNSVSPIYSYAKIYYFKLWDNETLVRDMIPVLDSNNRPCMYDKITDTFFYNLGTGEFKYGKKGYYCEVEYLESTGTQYIDTGVVFSNSSHTYKWDIGAQAVDTGDTNYNWFCGFFEGGANSAGTYSDTATNYKFYAVGTYYQNGQVITSPLTNGDKYGIIRNVFTLTNSVGTLPIILFGRNQSNGVKCEATKKIFYYKIYDNDTLVRDFIPVLDWNMVPCLYDKVTGKRYYNQGTGEFIAGRQIHPVEYLEANGTQYINTGLLSTADSKVDIEYGFTSMASGTAENCAIFGGRNNSTSTTFTFFKLASGNPQYFRFDYNAQKTIGTANNLTWNTESIYRFTYDGTRGTTYNLTTGQSTYENISPGSTYTTTPIVLFAVNTNDAINTNMSGRIYKYWYTDGTNTVDMIPAMDENGIGYMFDRESHTCYLNQGTGDFAYGPLSDNNLMSIPLVMKKKALMMASYHQNKYTILKSLISDGNSYIDTKQPLTANSIIEITAASTDDTQNNNTLCGVGTDGSSADRVQIHFGSTAGEVTCRIDGTLSSGVAVGTDQFNAQIDIQKQKAYLNGTEIISSYSSNIDTTRNVTLWCRNTQSGQEMFAKAKISAFRHYTSDGRLLRDMVPVLDTYGAPCMWDRANDKLYYNEGTGDFSYETWDYLPCDYLESTGTQYTDTYVYLTNNHTVELDYQLTATSQPRAGLYGALVGTGTFTGRYGTLLSPTNSYLEYGYGASNIYYQQGAPNTNRHYLVQEKNKIIVDGNLLYTFDEATFNITTSSPLGNFAYTNYTPAKAKYYSSKWYYRDITIRDFVPVIDKDNRAGFYDKCTNIIFYSVGSSDFEGHIIDGNKNYRIAKALISDGNEYINLGMKYASSMSIAGKFTRTAQGDSGSVIFITTDTKNPVLYFPALNAGASVDRYVWRRPGYDEQNYYYEFNTYPTTQEIYLNAANDTLTVNGNIVLTGMIAGMNGYASPYKSDSVMYLFGIGVTYQGIGKINYCKIWDEGELILDLLPAHNGTEWGMYDLVNKTFYTNQDSGGSFTAET